MWLLVTTVDKQMDHSVLIVRNEVNTMKKERRKERAITLLIRCLSAASVEEKRERERERQRERKRQTDRDRLIERNVWVNQFEFLSPSPKCSIFFFFSSLARSLYISFFLFCFLLCGLRSPLYGRFNIFLFIIIRSSLLVGIRLSVCITKSQIS